VLTRAIGQSQDVSLEIYPPVALQPDDELLQMFDERTGLPTECPLHPALRKRAAAAAGGEPALRARDGKVHALDDVCTHALALLSQGFIEGGAVECPLHGARFDIATGRCLAPPATVDLRTYEVRIEGGEVFVRAAD